MLLVLLIVFAALAVFCKYRYDHSSYKYEFAWFGAELISIILAVCLLVCVLFLMFQVPKSKIVDTKITTLEQENKKIEQDIDSLVTAYMEHEAEVINSVKPSSSMTLVQLYPELKSNELVKSQIEVYTDNNNRIKEYKLSKSNYEVYKWLLYFGGKFK